jgi:NAD(P)H-dependent FMN reductase
VSHILGISGSLRKRSYNSALLREACVLYPGVIQAASIAEFPLYNGDLEDSAWPPAVEALKRQLDAADGLLLCSPEYNNSIPGVLKNAIDWLSRPSGGIRNVFRHKPVAVIGASPGGFGTILAQNAWLPVLRALGARHWSGGRLLVSAAARVFDDEGQLVDDPVRDRLNQFLREFAGFCGVETG